MVGKEGSDVGWGWSGGWGMGVGLGVWGIEEEWDKDEGEEDEY